MQAYLANYFNIFSVKLSIRQFFNKISCIVNILKYKLILYLDD